MLKDKKSILILFFGAILPFLLALPIDLIDIDTAQYGEISRELLENNDWLHLRDNGKKYLDKPIMTFWIIASFFKTLGISNITFRLPAFLAALISFWSIYRIVVLRTEETNKGILAGLAYLVIPATFTLGESNH
jgi:4-amino-4-deoxy-L-arabinose transferase-like glycosyltransferase